MANLLNDPKHWRERAGAMRALSQQMADLECKRTMLKIADDYESLAERAEERNASIPAAHDVRLEELQQSEE
jgi:hypothetical protein